MAVLAGGFFFASVNRFSGQTGAWFERKGFADIKGILETV
jgi:hypothetical protein